MKKRTRTKPTTKRTESRAKAKDLDAKDAKQVKGGAFQDFTITRKIDKASPILF